MTAHPIAFVLVGGLGLAGLALLVDHLLRPPPPAPPSPRPEEPASSPEEETLRRRVRGAGETP